MSSLFAFETLYCFLSILCVIKLKKVFWVFNLFYPFWILIRNWNCSDHLILSKNTRRETIFREEDFYKKNMFVVWVPKKASNECCYCQRIEIICNGIFVPKNTLLLGKIADVEIMLFFWFCFYISCQLLM